MNVFRSSYVHQGEIGLNKLNMLNYRKTRSTFEIFWGVKGQRMAKATCAGVTWPHEASWDSTSSACSKVRFKMATSALEIERKVFISYSMLERACHQCVLWNDGQSYPRTAEPSSNAFQPHPSILVLKQGTSMGCRSKAQRRLRSCPWPNECRNQGRPKYREGANVCKKLTSNNWRTSSEPPKNSRPFAGKITIVSSTNSRGQTTCATQPKHWAYLQLFLSSEQWICKVLNMTANLGELHIYYILLHFNMLTPRLAFSTINCHRDCPANTQVIHAGQTLLARMDTDKANSSVLDTCGLSARLWQMHPAKPS